jgi:hypothetical protein
MKSALFFCYKENGLNAQIPLGGKMKKLFLLGSLLTCLSSFAGGILDIPVQLLSVENHGRTLFIQNALAETGLLAKDTKYRDFKTIVIGGDEEGSDYMGGYFIFEAQLSSSSGRVYKCHQYLTVGIFHADLTRPISCETIK